MQDCESAPGPRTLAIDIGGSGLKMMVLGPRGEPVSDRQRERTPSEPTPDRVLSVLGRMARMQPSFDRVAAGFPGVVINGVTWTAVNLHDDWIGFDFATALRDMTGTPARVANDADVQGLAVIEGVGVEMVLTLGTGLGSALYVDRTLVPNLEIAHHVFRKNRTYEDYLGQDALDRSGRRKWSKHLRQAVSELKAMINFGKLYIGGGNSRKAAKAGLEGDVEIVPNVAGLWGCIHLWESEVERRR